MAQEPQRTVWDGVYTAAQAERGSTAYAQSCASCHAEDLRGRSTAPSLVEESFTFLWADMSLGDLFERTRTRMPSDRPNSLPAETYADIIAFIAQRNGYPAGSGELGTNAEVLKQILITGKPRP
jgi:S-disulfanyl-L-cysteine oxidoreductase SoxD